MMKLTVGTGHRIAACCECRGVALRPAWPAIYEALGMASLHWRCVDCLPGAHCLEDAGSLTPAVVVWPR